jgi:hypothetical protein
MSYVNTNSNEIQFTLTKVGKELGLKHGLLNVIKYFTVSDAGVIYTMDVEPTKLQDINGNHTTSTNVHSSVSKITIDK